MKGVRLRTPRLLVRDLPPSQAERVARFHRENWHFHRPWEPLRRDEFFGERYQRRLLRSERASDSALHLWLLLAEDGSSRWRDAPIVGSVTLSSIVRGFFQSCYLGYKMDARYTRRGLMREALTEVVGYAFSRVGLHRIEANAMPRNQASRSLLERLGFREEGLARRYLRIQGEWEDHVHMVVLSEEWAETGTSRRS
ncbi:MAG: GNAT family N-acetyltransferase [Spirochaetota bacterium]